VAYDLDEAHYYLALVYRMRNRRTEAAAEFRRTVELNPNHARAQGNLGFLELEAGRLPQALVYLTEAVRLDPNDALALGSLGTIKLQQGAQNEAAGLFRRVLAIDPQNEEARAGLKILGILK